MLPGKKNMNGLKVLPGSLLSASQPGMELKGGVYERNGQIFSSLLGKVLQDEKSIQVKSLSAQSIITPKINSLIIGKVVKINSRFATVEILVVGQDTIAGNVDFPIGIIQKKDVRNTNIDSVEIFKCFRPGDVVRCRVTSMGEQKSFILSTAHNSLGVVMAQSLAGYTMVPVSWEKMMCPKTKTIEFRKCAKPDSDDAEDKDQEMK